MAAPRTIQARGYELAQKVAAAIREPWLYARIDAVDLGGELVVMEVELIEPQLFFELASGAAGAMTAALRRLLDGGSAS